MGEKNNNNVHQAAEAKQIAAETKERLIKVMHNRFIIPLSHSSFLIYLFIYNF
jgi:hypothetical protein